VTALGVPLRGCSGCATEGCLQAVDLLDKLEELEAHLAALRTDDDELNEMELPKSPLSRAASYPHAQFRCPRWLWILGTLSQCTLVFHLCCFT
jgi:hypothetical protein